MNDKSPRQHLTKKSGKSIKQKRSEKKAKTALANSMEKLSEKKR
jgi:hypothetical protein